MNIPSTHSGFAAREAHVYLPPAWLTMDAPRLPALLLLPGVPGGPTAWTHEGEADQIADDFASRHDGLAPIIVMPDATGSEDADSECVNSSRVGNAETYLTVDVPAYVRAAFSRVRTWIAGGGWPFGGWDVRHGPCSPESRRLPNLCVVLRLRHPDLPR